MDTYERRLTQATASDTRDILGAIGLVVGKEGVLYHHAHGFQSLNPDSGPLDPNSTFALGSAGKFITHIAALQFVELGAISLDEPIYKYLPELEALPLIARSTAGNSLITARQPKNKITLRHLLLHTSGLSEDIVPIVNEYLATVPKREYSDDVSLIVKKFSIPLIFEPGEGFHYGNSIYWTQLLCSRLFGGTYAKCIQERIFDPIGMRSSTYMPRNDPEIWKRRLEMVERVNEKLVGADDATQGLMCTVLDIGIIFRDLSLPNSKLLKTDYINLLFKGQLAPSGTASRDLRANPENYSFCGVKLDPTNPPPLNWSFAGLVIEEDISSTPLPKGTITWEGMPNVLWAINKEKAKSMIFVTQLIPMGDKYANEIALTFMEAGWTTFG